MVPALEVWYNLPAVAALEGGTGSRPPPDCLLQHARIVYCFLADTFGMDGTTHLERSLINMIVEECEFMYV